MRTFIIASFLVFECFFTLNLPVFFSIARASDNTKDCSDLLSSRNNVFQFGHVNAYPYKIWKPQISTTEYKGIVGYAPSPGNLYRLRMGMANIGEDLLPHRHYEPEIYYITKGRGWTALGYPENHYVINLEEGTYFYIPGGLPHYTKAAPDQPLTVLYLFPRYGPHPIKYIYDDTNTSFLKAPFKKNITTIGKIPLLQEGQKVHTLVQDGELSFERVLLSPNDHLPVLNIPDDVILYVNKGHARIFIEGHKVPLQLKEGHYLYLSQGHRFFLEGKESQRGEVFIFGRKPSL